MKTKMNVKSKIMSKFPNPESVCFSVPLFTVVLLVDVSFKLCILSFELLHYSFILNFQLQMGKSNQIEEILTVLSWIF